MPESAKSFQRLKSNVFVRLHSSILIMGVIVNVHLDLSGRRTTDAMILIQLRHLLRLTHQRNLQQKLQLCYLHLHQLEMLLMMKIVQMKLTVPLLSTMARPKSAIGFPRIPSVIRSERKDTVDSIKSSWFVLHLVISANVPTITPIPSI